MPAHMKTLKAMRARVADEIDQMHARVGWEIRPNPALHEWTKRQAEARRARQAAENDGPEIREGSDSEDEDDEEE